MKKIIVWYEPNRDVYYDKYVNNWSSYCAYERGYVNSYGHIIVHIIEPQYDYYERLALNQPLHKRIVNKLISFLKKFV